MKMESPESGEIDVGKKCKRSRLLMALVKPFFI